MLGSIIRYLLAFGIQNHKSALANKTVELTACSQPVYRKGRADSAPISAAAHFHVRRMNIKRNPKEKFVTLYDTAKKCLLILDHLYIDMENGISNINHR